MVRAEIALSVLAVAAGDPSANRVVYGAVIALIVIGVILLGVAVWLFRQTRVDPELLAPLERMSDRAWAKRDPATQRRMLDEVRPEGAQPLHREPSAPVPDEEFDKPLRPVSSFEDLKDPEPESDEVDGGDEPAAEETAAEEPAVEETEIDEQPVDDQPAAEETDPDEQPVDDQPAAEETDAEGGHEGPVVDEEPAVESVADDDGGDDEDHDEGPVAGGGDEVEVAAESAEAAGEERVDAVDEPDDVVDDSGEETIEAVAGPDDSTESSDEAEAGDRTDAPPPEPASSAWPAPEDIGAGPK